MPCSDGRRAIYVDPEYIEVVKPSEFEVSTDNFRKMYNQHQDMLINVLKGLRSQDDFQKIIESASDNGKIDIKSYVIRNSKIPMLDMRDYRKENIEQLNFFKGALCALLNESIDKFEDVESISEWFEDHKSKDLIELKSKIKREYSKHERKMIKIILEEEFQD